MLGAERAVWLCHTSDSQHRRAPEAGAPNVQVISERALTVAGRNVGKVGAGHDLHQQISNLTG